MVSDKQRLYKETAETLKNGGIEFAEFEARQLVDEFFGTSDSDGAEQALMAAVERRLNHEPLQYIIGQWEFYGLPFFVGDGVLVPRPDTEILVDEALKFLKDRPASAVADLCSGSGCIAVSVAKNVPDAAVTAVEKFPAAFEYLKRNAELNGVSINCILGDAFANPFGENFPRFDLVLSNPPYIPHGVLPSLQFEVQKEPQTALDGGEDGLDFYKALAETAPHILKNGGKIMAEIGYDQKLPVTEIFSANGISNIKCIKDYSGNDRVISGTYSPDPSDA